jgi:hypothetical protein
MWPEQLNWSTNEVTVQLPVQAGLTSEAVVR